MLDLVPKLNYDALVELGLYLSFEATLNDKQLWRTFENAVLENFHLYELQHICQIQWAVTQLKPKYTSQRLDVMLHNFAREKIDQGNISLDDFHDIMQGFRNKKSKDFYLKLKAIMIDQKEQLIGSESEAQRAKNLSELFFSFASNKPGKFGVYADYAIEEVDELIAHYEDDLVNAVQHLNADEVTRLAQAMYLLKSAKYENVWRRIENKVHDLIEDEMSGLDAYHVTNLLRAFSRSQNNTMAGSNKLFVHLEPFIIRNMGQFQGRDLGHVMYAYSVRNVGNPELYKAFDARIEGLIAYEVFDYPMLSNLIYYMLFRTNTNETIWKAIVEHTAASDDVLPLTYYKPFKFSKFFLAAHFPEWDLSDYLDKFYYAERYFNQIQLDDYGQRVYKYTEMKAFLNQKCLVYPIVFMTLHNLFNLHYVFYDFKIAINYHVQELCDPITKQPNERMKL